MMYIWVSDTLKQYSEGHIIVVADSVEKAREKVLDRFDYCLNSGNHDNWFEITGAHLWDQSDDQEEIKNIRDRLIKDLSSEPTTSDLLMIPGSC